MVQLDFRRWQGPFCSQVFERVDTKQTGTGRTRTEIKAYSDSDWAGSRRTAMSASVGMLMSGTPLHQHLEKQPEELLSKLAGCRACGSWQCSRRSHSGGRSVVSRCALFHFFNFFIFHIVKLFFNFFMFCNFFNFFHFFIFFHFFHFFQNQPRPCMAESAHLGMCVAVPKKCTVP